MGKRANHGFYGWMKSLSEQKCTPKSNANAQMEQNRPETGYNANHNGTYKYAWTPDKGEFGRIFYTPKDMSRLRHTESVLNSRRNRGEIVRELSAFDAY